MNKSMKRRLDQLESRIATPTSIAMMAFDDDEELEAYMVLVDAGEALPVDMAIMGPGLEDLVTPADADLKEEREAYQRAMRERENNLINSRRKK